jgi:LysB family phage lysis regulatory protein
MVEGEKPVMSLRLAIAAALAIAFLSLVGTALWFRGQAISAAADATQARADLGTAIAANKAQEETIGRLRASAEANDRIVAEMADRLAAINEAVTENNAARNSLKDSDENVRSYLDTPVPDALRRLYDK